MCRRLRQGGWSNYLLLQMNDKHLAYRLYSLWLMFLAENCHLLYSVADSHAKNCISLFIPGIIKCCHGKAAHTPFFGFLFKHWLSSEEGDVRLHAEQKPEPIESGFERITQIVTRSVNIDNDLKGILRFNILEKLSTSEIFQLFSSRPTHGRRPALRYTYHTPIDVVCGNNVLLQS